MLPIQVIFLLLLVNIPRSLVTLDEVHAATQPGQTSPALLLLGFYAAHLALVMVVAYRARGAIRLLHSAGSNATDISTRADRMFNQARWATLLLTSTFMFSTRMPALVLGWLDQTSVLKFIPPLAEAFFLGPAILSWLAFWTAGYYFDSASRERSFPYRLAQGLATHEMPTLGQYLSMQCRHNFYFFVPAILLALVDPLGHLAAGLVPVSRSEGAENIFATLGAVAVFLTMPWMLVHIWTTAPLGGELRTQLDGIAAAHRLRFRNILLWKTHNAVSNAAILGWIPFSRYFLMTDALLESLTDKQIESVFAHEVGHGVHWHMWWYLGAFAGAVGLAGGTADFWVREMLASWAHFAGSENSTGVIVMMAGLGLFLMVGFPLISHGFEHQADWFASRHMARVIELMPRGQIAVFTTPMVPLPAVLQTPLSMAAETVTMAEYMAGAYPHSEAGVVPPATMGAAANLTPATPEASAKPAEMLQAVPAVVSLTAEQAGAEVFISSLDAIVELSHRSREKKGWMHPSINHRIWLLRQLSRNSMVVAAFERRMVRIRVAIVLLMLAGAACTWASMRNAERRAEDGAASAPVENSHMDFK